MYGVTIKKGVLNGKGNPQHILALIRKKSNTARMGDSDAGAMVPPRVEPCLTWRDHLDPEVLAWLAERDIIPARLEPLTIYFHESDEAIEFRMRWG